MRYQNALGSLVVSVVAALLLAGCGSEVGTTSRTPESSGSGETKLTGKLVMNGSTSMEEVCGALKEALMAHNPDLSVEIQATGSGAAVKALDDGIAQIGNLSRAVKEEENAEGQYAAVTIALDGIAVVVHPDNGVSDLTVEDLKAIYTKEKTNWKDFGGRDAAIHVVGREEGSGTRDGFESIVVKDCLYDVIASSTGNVIAQVKSDENAIGYVSFASVNEEVKALKVGGISPSEESIGDKTYAIQRPFVHAYKKDTTDPNVLGYLEFLKTEEAQSLIKAQKLVPVKFW